VLNATSNAALTFVAANLLSGGDFGRFALMMTGVVIIVGAVRSVTSEPYTVLTGDQSAAVAHSWMGPALGASVLLGGAVALPGIAVGLTLGWADLVAFSAAAALVAGQDCVRYLLVARRRTRAAFVNDLVWLVVQFVLTGVAIGLGHASAPILAWCWAIGAAAGLLVGLVQLKTAPRIDRALLWGRETRSWSGYYLLEFAALAGSGYSIIYVVAAASGLTQAGAYRGAQALYGPVTSLIGGLRMVALPSLVQLRPRGKPAIVRGASMVGVGLGLLSVSVMLVLWLTDSWLAPLLLGATAAGALPLVIPMGLGRAASSMSAGPLLGMRVLGATKASLGTRVALSLVTVVCAWAGALFGGAIGAAWGFALASLLACMAWFRMMTRQPLRLGGENAWPGSQGVR
jgi:O-antigen/teichoic acid export membrane protein